MIGRFNSADQEQKYATLAFSGFCTLDRPLPIEAVEKRVR
jgi:hypothetical protein